MIFLVVDTGSSSMRTTLLDENGRKLFSSAREYHMVREEDGKCEIDAEVYNSSLTDLTKAAVGFASKNHIQIDCMAFTSQRSSVLTVDERCKPLGPIMMWQDARCAGICEDVLRETGREVYEISGMRLTQVSSAPKMKYLKQIRPEQYEKAYKLIGIHDYLLYQATNIFATDSSLASRTCLMDIQKLSWSSRLCEIFSVDKDKLCKIHAPGDIVGYTTEDFAKKTGITAGIPVITAGGDQQSSVLGQGIIAPGEIGITIGTGAYVTAASDKPIFDPEMCANLSAAVTPGCWILEASTLSSGNVFRWFNEEFYDQPAKDISYEDIDRDIEMTEPGANGLIALPYLSGKGFPDWDPYASGVFFNLSAGTSKADMSRALLEGIAFDVEECFARLKEMTGKSDRIIICGGLSKFPAFIQMLADILGETVIKASIAETTVHGALIQAAVAMGIYQSCEEAVGVLCHSEEAGVYRPNMKVHQKYMRIKEARRRLYESIPFKEIRNTLNGVDKG